jgi:hypothetical protein
LLKLFSACAKKARVFAIAKSYSAWLIFVVKASALNVNEQTCSVFRTNVIYKESSLISSMPNANILIFFFTDEEAK